jgi:hypothetical protein
MVFKSTFNNITDISWQAVHKGDIKLLMLVSDNWKTFENMEER